MSDRLLHYFEQELESIKQEGAEFAKANPGLASNLGINEKGIDDPNVNRLIESVAFLNAKISKKLDDGVDELSESILGTLYPDVDAPFPAVSSVQFQLDGSLTTASKITKGELLSIINEKGEEWTFSTAANAKLSPIEIVEANYHRLPFEKPEVESNEKIKAKMSIDFATQKEVAKDEVITIDEIDLKISDEQRINSLIYAAIAKECLCIEVSYGNKTKLLKSSNIKKAGFDTELRLLPKSYQQLDGMQLAREVLNSQQSFEYLRIEDLSISLGATDKLTLNIYLSSENSELEQNVSQRSFQYGCVPIVNLYRKSAEPYKLKGNERSDIEVRGLKGGPLEVYKIDSVDCLQGKSERKAIAAAYQPGMKLERNLKWSAKRTHNTSEKGNYCKTTLTVISKDEVADEIICPQVWVKNHNNISRNINRSQQLDIEFQEARSEFKAIALAEPVREGMSIEHDGQSRWTLLKRSGIGYITNEGVAAIKEILQQANIYQDKQVNLMIDAISACDTQRLIRRAFDNNHSGFINGQKITLHISNEVFGNFSLYLFGLVISRLLTELTTINSFTELELITAGQQQAVVKYPAQMGQIQFI